MAALITQLEAVNTILATMGEGGLSALPADATDEDGTNATNVLDEISKAVQSEGWHFNSEYEVSITPAAGQITVPTNALKIDPTDISVNAVQRGGYLYDLDEHADDEWGTSNLKCDIVYLLGWDDLPPIAQRYIMIRAARLFIDRYVGSDVVRGYTTQEELAARGELVDWEGGISDATIFGPNNQIINRRSPFYS